MRLKLLNLMSASYDGATWLLSAKELVDGDGRVVATDADADWRARLHALGLTESPLSKDTFVYYNDNPAVYGVPDAEIRVGKTTFRVSDLAEGASWEPEDAPVLWAEV